MNCHQGEKSTEQAAPAGECCTIMDDGQQRVDIIIPNYNGLKVLVPCLQSIAEQSHCRVKIIIVDNGSSDGSVDYIAENFPDVQLIALSENTGFSAAVNTGINAGSSPLIFLLNNDTELEPGCLEHLVTASGTLTDYDFFAPKMLSFQERTVLDGAGDGYLRGGAGYRLGTMERDSDVYNQAGPVFGACAGAVLYRRSLFDRVGLFDADFFAYLEDVDLNLRINRAGLSGYYFPASVVYHIGSATSGSKINEFTVRLSTRNSLLVLLKNYRLSLFLRLLPVIVIYQFCWFLFVIKKGQFLPYAQGVWHALTMTRQMRHKHRQLRKLDSLSTAEFAACLKEAEKSVVASIMRRRSAEGKGNLLFQLYGFFFL